MVSLTNGTQACNVYWTMGSAATLGTYSIFAGHVLAVATVAANTGAAIEGQLMSRDAAVTLDTNTITNNNCAAAVIKHRVIYYGNTSTGGTAPYDVSSPYVRGSAVTVLGQGSLVKTGSTFTHWNTAANGLGISYAPAAVFAISVDTDLYAQWTPTPTPTPTPSATLHVVKTVVNDDGGTTLPSDFLLHVTLNGVDVAGSPAVGISGAGRAYVLPAGNYAVSEDPAAGYLGSFSGPGITDGSIALTPGSDVTITRTNNDIAKVVVVAPTPTPKPVVTVTGGKLPKTGSPWYNLLAVGAGLTLLGGISWTLRKRRA